MNCNAVLASILLCLLLHKQAHWPQATYIVHVMSHKLMTALPLTNQQLSLQQKVPASLLIFPLSAFPGRPAKHMPSSIQAGNCRLLKMLTSSLCISCKHMD